MCYSGREVVAKPEGNLLVPSAESTVSEKFEAKNISTCISQKKVVPLQAECKPSTLSETLKQIKLY